MADTKIGGIHVEASLGVGKFVEGSRKLQAEAKKSEAQLKSSFSAMGVSVKGFAGAMTAGLSVGLLAGIGKKLLDNVAALKSTAQQLGVTTRELQLFSYAAGQVGIKQQEADKALERLNVSMGKAVAGSKTAIAAFNAVGVSVDDIKTKSKTEIFGQIADQMIKQGGAARNAAAANAIFGESASKLTPLLDKGSAGMNELAAAAERLGIVLSDQQIQQADETARKLDDVKRVLAAQISGVVADNAASILSLADALGKLTSAIINFLGSNPTAALAILGALAGSRFGLVGAAAGGFAGAVIGSGMGRTGPAPVTSADTPFYRHNLKKERERLLAKRAAGQPLKVSEVERLNRMTNLVRQSIGQAPLGTAGNFPVPEFLASGGGGGGGRKRTPRAPRDTSLRDAHRFSQELLRAEMDTLRAQQALATDTASRSAITLQLLDLEKQSHEEELKYRVAAGEITQAQADQLSLEYEKKDALERDKVAAEIQAQAREDAARLANLDFDLERDRLESASRLAETAAEQRDIQLRLLDLSYRQERARLDAILAEEQVGSALWEEARRRRANLDQTFGTDRQAVIQGTRGPAEGFMAGLPTTTAKWEEALQAVAVNGFGSLEDAILDTITGVKSLGDAFRDVAQQILADLLRIAIQRAIIAPLANALFPGAGSAVGAAAAVPGFAGGGGFNVLGNPGIDRNVLSLNNIPIARVSYNERVNVSNDNVSSGSSIPTFVFNNYARMSSQEARRTGMQAAAGWRAGIAEASKKGIG